MNICICSESSEDGLVVTELESQLTWWDRLNAALKKIIATTIMFFSVILNFITVKAIKECLGFYPFRSLCP